MDLKEYRLNVSTGGPFLMEFAILNSDIYGISLDLPFRKFLGTGGKVVPYFLIGPCLDFWHSRSNDILTGGGHLGFGEIISAYPFLFDGQFKTRYTLGKDFFGYGTALRHEILVTLEIRNDIVLSPALDFETALTYEAITAKNKGCSWSDFYHRFVPYIGFRYYFGRNLGYGTKYATTAEQPTIPTVHPSAPTPAFKPTIPKFRLPNIHNVSLGTAGRYKCGSLEGLSGHNLSYRGRNTDNLYYFFPAATIATMSKEIESYRRSYKIGKRVFSISEGAGFNLRHLQVIASMLPPALNPYLECGVGYAISQYRYWDDDWDESDWDWFALTWNIGLGMEYWLTKQTALDLHFNRQHIIDFGDPDFHYWDMNLGLTFRQ